MHKLIEENNIFISIIDEFYSPQLLANNRSILFVFGDNLNRVGKGGQAIIRDEINSVGVATKVLPGLGMNAYFNDANLEMNMDIINQDLKFVIEKAISSYQYKHIVFPKGGLGTGLSDLPNKAPKTFEYLTKKLKDDFNIFTNTKENNYTLYIPIN